LASELQIDKRSPSDFWDDQHKKLASEPLTWTLTADELLRAFELLATQVKEDLAKAHEQRNNYIPSTFSSALMLAGFAIENMLKALLVTQRPAFDSSGNFSFKTHDLLKLADDVGLNLSMDERILLERLEQFLTWAGRYPVPLCADTMRPRTLPSGGFAPRTYGWIDGDFQEIRTLTNKLRSKLEVISDGSDAI